MLYISAKYVNLKTGNTSLRKLKDNKMFTREINSHTDLLDLKGMV